VSLKQSDNLDYIQDIVQNGQKYPSTVYVQSEWNIVEDAVEGRSGDTNIFLETKHVHLHQTRLPLLSC
jgi:hypothetical protein